jgi:hypothetical protein
MLKKSDAQQVHKQDADANEDQDNAASDLHALAKLLTELVAQAQTQPGEQAGDDANDDGRIPDGKANHTHTEPHCQGIEANGHREKHESPTAGRIGLVVPARLVEAGADHAHADEAEQTEGNPMIVGGDVTNDGETCQPAEDGHDELEQAEMEGQAETGTAAAGLCKGASAKANSECVHGHAEGDQKDIDDIHG